MQNKHKKELAVLLTTVIMSALLMLCLAAEAPNDAEITVLKHAQAEGVSLQAYPESLIALLDRNPEAKEFVLNYPFRQELEIDLSGCDLSQGVPLLIQWDPRWGYRKYSGDFVGVTGCGPLCLSMAGYYLTGDPRFYPDKVLEFATKNGYAADGSGSRWTLISQGGRDLGLSVKEIAPEEKKVAAYLDSGALIIAVMGPGDFTGTGHFIVLTGYEDGKVSVNDPNSYVNSEKQWKFASIKDQFRNLWIIQKGAEG